MPKSMVRDAATSQSKPLNRSLHAAKAAKFNKLGLKKLITTSYDGSPIAGMDPGTLFAEYNEGNGKRQKPKALCVILDHVKDEDGDALLPKLISGELCVPAAERIVGRCA